MEKYCEKIGQSNRLNRNKTLETKYIIYTHRSELWANNLDSSSKFDPVVGQLLQTLFTNKKFMLDEMT